MAVKRYNGTAWVTEAGGIPAFLGGFRNRIINGDFRINQRAYVSAANLASGAYGFDRWKSNFTNTTLTFTSAPQGQIVTINSGGGLQQVVERANMPAGTYVLTWTGTATARVYNSGGTAPSYAASPVTVTLDGTADVVVEFTASGGTRTLQNVQLEAGSVSTTFEQRPIGTELALCQRYYHQVSNPTNIVNMRWCNGLQATTTGSELLFYLPVSMRAQPVVTYAGSVAITDSFSYTQAITGLTTSTTGPNPVMMSVTHAGVGASRYPIYGVLQTNTGFVYFNAEL